MKFKPTLRPILAALGASVIAISYASGQTDGTWNQPEGGTYDWTDATNWLDDTVAGGTGAIASFTVNSSGAQTVNLDEDVTLGSLIVDRNQNLRIESPEGEILTFDVETDSPLISASSGRFVRITSPIAGSNGLEITGGAVNGGIALRGENTFTGGIQLNGGSLGYNQPGDGTTRTNQAGLNDNQITVSGTSFAHFENGTQVNGGIHINEGAEFRSGVNNNNYTISGPVTGTGTLTHQQYGAGNQRINLTSTTNTFTGDLDYDMPRSATFRVNSLGDGGLMRFGIAGIGPDAGGATRIRTHLFEFDSGGVEDMVFNTRQIELYGSTVLGRYEIRNSNNDHALMINTDIINEHTGTDLNFRLSGSSGQDNTIAGSITDGPGDGDDPSALNLTKLDGGSWILTGDNSYTGTTTVSAGTLVINGDQSQATGPVEVNGTSTLDGSGTLGGDVTVAADANLGAKLTFGGDLNISAMAGGNGRLFYEIGSIAASDQISVSGALDIGEGLLGFDDFDFTDVGGLGGGTYTLISSDTLTGTLDGSDIQGTIGTLNATLQISGNDIELVVVEPNPTTTLVIDLGEGTQIPGGAFGTFGALNLPIPALPEGSILRSIEIDAELISTDNENFASDLAVLFDPTPETPGDDFSVVITNGMIDFGATVQLGWPAAADEEPPAPLVDTKFEADWSDAGTIDLATTGIFLGNSFNLNEGAPQEGGTWSGTITLTYDEEPTGTPFELWAGPGVAFDGDESGDGVPNGLAFLLGAASPGDNAIDLLPVANEDAGGLVLTFSMLDADARGSATLSIEHSSDLGISDAWTTVTVPDTSSTVDDVVFTITGSSPLEVTATIPASKAGNGKLFARLRAVVAIP